MVWHGDGDGRTFNFFLHDDMAAPLTHNHKPLTFQNAAHFATGKYA